MDVSDRELVSKVQAGDWAAFGELMRRHQQAVYRVAYRLLLSHADKVTLGERPLVTEETNLRLTDSQGR